MNTKGLPNFAGFYLGGQFSRVLDSAPAGYLAACGECSFEQCEIAEWSDFFMIAVVNYHSSCIGLGLLGVLLAVFSMIVLRIKS